MGYQERRIIVNADDFGYSQGINKGVREAYRHGILTSTTAFANGDPAETDLANLESDLSKPKLGIGVHLNLTTGAPTDPEIWTIQTFTRPFKGTNQPQEWQGSAWREFFARFNPEVVYQEFRQQILRVQELFGEIDHLDSHHAVTSYSPIDQIYLRLAREFNLAVRHLSPISEIPVYGGEFQVVSDYAKIARSQKVKTIDRIDMRYFYKLAHPVDAFCEVLALVKENEVVEFMFHPAIDNLHGEWRMLDLQILTNSKVIKAIESSGIKLTTYRDSASLKMLGSS